MSEPDIVKSVREEAKTSWKCGKCGASRRGTVDYDKEWAEPKDNEIVIEICCRSCGYIESRYYPK